MEPHDGKLDGASTTAGLKAVKKMMSVPFLSKFRNVPPLEDDPVHWLETNDIQKCKFKLL